MAGKCCGGETETSAPVEPSSKAARRRRMEVHQFRFLGADMAAEESDRKRKKLEIFFRGRRSVRAGSKIGWLVVRRR